MEAVTKRIIPLIILGLIGSAQSLAEPVAVVEDVNFSSDRIQPMDFLDAGTIFEFRPSESIMIGYLSSCVLERIKGGKVTIGQRQSIVIGGAVNRSTLECVSGDKIGGSVKNQAAAAVVFRRMKNKNAATIYKIIYSHFPIVRLGTDDGQLMVTRADGKGDPKNVAIEKGIADFGKSRFQLERNKIYIFSFGGKTMTVKVSPRAKRDAPLLSRVMLF